MTEIELCALCNLDEDKHRVLEARGTIHHKFSALGNLERVEATPEAKAKRKAEVMVVPGVDLTLRALLIEKGILSESDFEDAGAYGGFPPRDRQDRQSPISPRGLRIAPEHPTSDGGEDDPGPGTA